jgi:hypothetical protein
MEKFSNQTPAESLVNPEIEKKKESIGAELKKLYAERRALNMKILRVITDINEIIAHPEKYSPEEVGACREAKEGFRKEVDDNKQMAALLWGRFNDLIVENIAFKDGLLGDDNQGRFEQN